MSTYSLNLRSNLNRRLTINEMDGNFLYLQELSLNGGTGSGINGTSGTSGINGTSGTSGSNGADGMDGIEGSAGTSGTSGTSGSNGFQGAPGQNGTSGTSGDSASGYRGFYAGINRLSGDDPTITQIVISKSSNASYKNRTNDTENDDFYVSGLSGSDTIVILNVYGVDSLRPLKIKDIRNFLEKFVDIILYTEGTLNSDLTVIKDLFYDNIDTLTSSLPVGTLYRNFTFQDQTIEYTADSYTTSGTGSGTFSIFKRSGDYKGYDLGGEGGPNEPNTNFSYGFQSGDIINISGTAFGGQTPLNDIEIYVNNTIDGVVTTIGNLVGGSGYSSDGDYFVGSNNTGEYANVSIKCATGSVTSVTLTYGGYYFQVGDIITLPGGNNDATIEVLSIRDGVINNNSNSNYRIVGIPDYSSPYRNSSNPWPINSIRDGGWDQYDGGNYITTDKSISEFIGSIEYIGGPSPDDHILTVTEIISGTISVGQTIKHSLDSRNDIYIYSGTLDGGIGTYSVDNGYDGDLGSRFFTAYGLNYGAGEVIEDNSFGTSSSYVTLYDESIFAMIAINADIDKIWYSGDSGSDGGGRKEVNVLFTDDNTKVDLILPETDTLGWMSVFGPLYNYDDDIKFKSSVIDKDDNTYSAGYNHSEDKPTVVKFNKNGDIVWQIYIYNNDNYEDGEANSVKIDPVNGDVVVLCETYPDYTEGLIVRIDPETGEIRKVNRLADINVLQEQGDLHLYDMTFNNNNELIVVGRKDSEYLQWVIGTSSILSGSTFSTLVISPSSIDNNVPDTYGGWSISGDGIIGDEQFSEFNTFYGVTGSITPGGSSASFTIQSDYAGYYTILGIDTPGTGYTMSVLKPIVVPGTSLGGITPDNDAIIIQTDVLNGGIIAATISGNGPIGQSPSGTQSFSGVTGTTVEGSGVVFDIHIVPVTGEYELWNSYGQQSNYVVNDIITIPGNLLGGTSSNDCTLTITGVDNGIVQSAEISGTGITSSYYLTIDTPVDFSASGTWSIYKSVSAEAYIYTENWERTLGGNLDYNDQFTSVITGTDNSIYAIGAAYGSIETFEGMFVDTQIAIISKFSSTGDHLWTKALNELEENCSGKSVAILGTNSIVTTHYSDYDGEIIISKLTTDGDLVWQKITDGDNSSVVTDIPNGNDISSIYVLGENNGSLKLFKLNTDGVMIWSNEISGEENYYTNNNTLSINNNSLYNNRLAVAGYTYVMGDDYSNAFLANLPTDGSLVDYKGISNYYEESYTILSITQSYYGTFTPVVGTHSVTYSRELYFERNNSYFDNNIDRINDVETGIVFSDGTKQTSSAGVIPQIYHPSNDDYYLQLSDIGKHIYKDDSNDYGVYIPTNKRVPFPIGTAITVVSGNSRTYFRLDDSDITKLWGAGFDDYSTGFFIPNNSMATLLKIGIDKWMVSGAGLDID